MGDFDLHTSPRYERAIWVTWAILQERDKDTAGSTNAKR